MVLSVKRLARRGFPRLSSTVQKKSIKARKSQRRTLERYCDSCSLWSAGRRQNAGNSMEERNERLRHCSSSAASLWAR